MLLSVYQIYVYSEKETKLELFYHEDDFNLRLNFHVCFSISSLQQIHLLSFLLLSSKKFSQFPNTFQGGPALFRDKSCSIVFTFLIAATSPSSSSFVKSHCTEEFKITHHITQFETKGIAVIHQSVCVPL